MRKLTQEQISEIITLKNKDMREIEIAKQFKVSQKTINYHLNPETRRKNLEYFKRWYNNLTSEQKKKRIEKFREYQKNYHRNRYQTDEVFRKKQIERCKK